MKNILITGVTGTIGKKLLEKLSGSKSKYNIVGIDINEEELFYLESKYLANNNVSFKFCDVKDFDNLVNICSKIDLIYHTAALKHVIFSEELPSAAVQTNILGVQNIIKAAHENNVNKVIFTSSDKAVNPTSVMGTSKLMGEKLITSSNFINKNKKTKFASVRFGNVLGSSGSFIPLFYNQIKNNRKITITDKKMTRYVMTINDAVDLMIKCTNDTRGGEVFVFKMSAVKVLDVAEAMIELFGKDKKIKKEFIGSRPGEKLYEELISLEELRRTKEYKSYFVIYPPYQKGRKKININQKLNISSLDAKYISKKDIKRLIKFSFQPNDSRNEKQAAFLPFKKK